MRVAVVMPVGAGRAENVRASLEALYAQTRRPELVVIVADGTEALIDVMRRAGPRPRDQDWARIVGIDKHEPGAEQPRNVGVRKAVEYDKEITHAWFVDSDVVMEPTALEDFEEHDPPGVCAGPYDWLGPGVRPGPNFTGAVEANDPRWPLFQRAKRKVFRHDVAAGLACFSGNLLWPVEEFQRVGGFWSELHHGRAEDGELGLRAVAMDVPISFCRPARGYHLWHPVDMDVILARNARDVPMLSERHAWMKDADVVLVDRDGAAFDVRCACGQQVPTNQWWRHAATCRATGMTLSAQNL